VQRSYRREQQSGDEYECVSHESMPIQKFSCSD
jgi:hypothetical protein